MTNYKVERCTAGVCTVIQTLKKESAGYSDTGLDLNKSYTYRVSAIDATGSSAAAEASAKTSQFAIQGANFGASIGFTAIPSNRIAKSARLVNGIVRVDDETNKFQPSAMVEAHYFFQQDAKFLWAVDKELCGHGPFIAVQPGNNVIQSVAFGWMVGFKHSKDAASSWNIGAGAVLNPSVQVLGDGITRNQPLPPGDNELRFKNTSLWGYVLLISFSWM